MDEVELATRRRRRTGIVVGVAIVVILGVFALTPRTVASGGEDDATWRLRIAPVAFGPQISLEQGGAKGSAGDSGFVLTARLDQTAVWHVGAGDDALTIVAGPTPGGASSVRVTSEDLGVGESSLNRVGWRRFHVERLRGHVEVTELVAIGSNGQVLEVLTDPPAPVTLP